VTLRDRPKNRSSHALLRGVLLAKAGAGIALTLAFVAGWWLRAHGLSVVDFQNDLKRGSEPRFQWRSVDKKHWQALGRVGVDPTAPVGEAADVTDTREANGAGCSAGMVRVKGSYRMGEVEHVQDGACVDWISKEFPARCRTFDKEKIASDVAKLPTRDLDFCMDRFEYPNALGQNPVIVVTFHEAESLCKKSSKRLCNGTSGRSRARAKRRCRTRTALRGTRPRASSIATGAPSPRARSSRGTGRGRARSSIASGRPSPLARARAAGARSASTT